MNEVKNKIEALLFSSGKAMKEEDISNIICVSKKEAKKALNELKSDYDNKDTALMLVQEGNSWKLNVREKYITLVTKIIADTELSKTVLETLSVIAWKAPALQSEVIKIRTNKAYDHIKELVELGFLTKEKEGRSYKLRLTEKFFEYFDVSGGKGIKEAFKEVKIPERKEPEKLGDLSVVDIENKEGEKSPGEEPAEREEIAKLEKPEDKVVDEEFLEKINKQIDEIAKKNDELDKDELFKRSEEEKSVEEGEDKKEHGVEESTGEEQTPEKNQEPVEEVDEEQKENNEEEVEKPKGEDLEESRE